MQTFYGQVKVGSFTKRLISEIRPNDMVMLQHNNMDDLAAEGLIKANVRAVINSGITMSGSFPLEGPLQLLQAGIPIFEMDTCYFGLFRSGMRIEIRNNMLFADDVEVQIPLTPFTAERWQQLDLAGRNNIPLRLNEFIENTLDYAFIEKPLVLQSLPSIKLSKPIENKPVLVVARGKGYKEDLHAMKIYIHKAKPLLMAVDGGADALLEFGYRPDFIIGDMDSVTDRALRCGAELIVHGYVDGRAPGLKRLQDLGLQAKVLSAWGTSEDVAMLLAYEQHAEWIVAVGSHCHMLEFLEKGREGMASTLLVRMKIGSKLIDAKGIHHLDFKRQAEKVTLAGARPWISKLVSALVVMTLAMSIGFMAAMWWNNGSRNVEPASSTTTESTATDKEDVHAFYYIDYNPSME